jgi:hypothetical protein
MLLRVDIHMVIKKGITHKKMCNKSSKTHLPAQSLLEKSGKIGLEQAIYAHNYIHKQVQGLRCKCCP